MGLLRDLRIWKLHIPLQVTFRHASASRSVTSSIWVEATSADQIVGFGEACPRSYVTGEDLDSCNAFFLTYRDELIGEIDDVDDLKAWVVAHQQAIDKAPAAWCAIELALIDLLARTHGKTPEQLLGVGELEGTFQYTAVLGDQSESAFAGQLQQYQAVGFQDFKVKLSGDVRQNAAKFSLLRDAGVAPQRTRVDANNLWPTADEARTRLAPLAESFFAIEEPLQPEDFDGMRQLASTLERAIILDESFQRVEQFVHIDSDPERWLINLRVSKMGGLFRSLDIVRLACDKNIGVIVGAQVGETSLLTRAALVVAHAARFVVRGQEGAFGKLLLATDVTDRPLAFGKRGRIETADHPACSSPLVVARPAAFLEKF